MIQTAEAVPFGTKKINKDVIKIFRALGTVNSICVPECPDNAAVDLAAKRVLEIDKRMSFFRTESDIGRINSYAHGNMVNVHDDTMYLLKKAEEFSKSSDGAFDITSGPLTMLWKKAIHNQTIPEGSEIRKMKKLIGYESLVFDEANCGVMLKRRGQQTDLGGIAKGYAADEVKRILVEHGVRSAIINLGGNIVALGTSPLRESWTIGVQDPFRRTGEYLGTLELKDETAVTSGTNEQFFFKDGIRYHHIIDPRTGMPADTDILSVTVIGECSVDMDALTTAVFVLGVEKGMELIKRFNAEAIFVGIDGGVYITERLKNRFHFINNQNNCEM